MRPRYRRLPPSVQREASPPGAIRAGGVLEPSKAVKSTGDACHLCDGTGWHELDIPRGWVARCECRAIH
jgi:hypothetical protein